MQLESGLQACNLAHFAPICNQNVCTAMSDQFDVYELAALFNACFEKSLRTRLEPGAEEPLYMPAEDAQRPHLIYSTRDYFASAMHEVSHWCIAGHARRQQVDYGYWYEPDGRTPAQQALFERVEVKPQALEWIFSRCCLSPFRFSVDNLHLPEAGASEHFKSAVVTQVMHYLSEGLPARARQFAEALGRHYRQSHWCLSELSDADFQLSCL